MTALIRFFVERPLFANLLTFLVTAVGISTAFTIQREAFPVVDFGVVTVTTLWPGAAPAEVERLVTVPLERKTQGLDGVKRRSSVSVENRSYLVFELEADLDAQEKDRAIKDIESAVAAVTDLPVEVERPLIAEMKSTQTPMIEINLSASDEGLVREHADELEDRLLDVRGVAAVVKRGWRERQVLVEVRPQALEYFHLSLAEVAAAVGGRNVNLPGGKVTRGGDEWLVRAVGEYEGTRDIEPVIIRANDSGGWIQVKDVAEVKNALEDVTVLNRSRGERSIDLVVIKKASADAIHVVDEVRATVEAYRPSLPGGVEAAYTNDFSYFVRRRLGIVTSNAYLGLALVVITLLIFLSPRIALWTAMVIPFSLFATLITLQFFGITLNLITMIGFILVIGMLVDQSIVVSENIFRHRQMGLAPVEAAVRGTREVLAPVFASVLTTMAAFLPLAFMGGIFGKFVWAIPLVVILALGFSLVESTIALPAHITTRRSASALPRRSRFDDIANVYAGIVARLLRRRYAVALGVLGVLAFSGLLASRMDFKLFSSEGIEVFMLRAQAAAGTPTEETERRFASIEKLIADLPPEELDTYTSQIGIQQQDPNDPFTRRGSHYAQAKVFLHPESDRERTAGEIIESLRSRLPAENGFERVYFARLNSGPPVGKPVSARFSADDFATLHRLEAMAREELAKVEGVVDIESDLEPGKKELRIVVNDAAAAEAGITAADIARSVRGAFDGFVATKIRKLDEEIDVKVLFPEQHRARGARALQAVRIPNRGGYLIPLGTVARVEEAVGFTSIKHFDGERIATITADVNPKATTSLRANQALQPLINKRMAQFREASVSYTGEDEDTRESLTNLARAFMVAAALIFLIMATTFGSLSQPALVMLTIPIGMAGVVFAFFLHGQPLGFLAMMGIIGLAGVVVNNAIVFIDFVNIRRRETGGRADDASVVEAARVRLRPIILTSLTTLAGLLPTAYGVGGDDPFVRPMALALGWGLAFSLLIVLFAMPPSIRILDDILGLPGALARWLRGRSGAAAAHVDTQPSRQE